jgi:hypothetical protein
MMSIAILAARSLVGGKTRCAGCSATYSDKDMVLARERVGFCTAAVVAMSVILSTTQSQSGTPKVKYPTEFDFSNVDPQTEEVSVSLVRIT